MMLLSLPFKCSILLSCCQQLCGNDRRGGVKKEFVLEGKGKRVIITVDFNVLLIVELLAALSGFRCIREK